MHSYTITNVADVIRMVLHIDLSGREVCYDYRFTVRLYIDLPSAEEKSECK